MIKKMWQALNRITDWAFYLLLALVAGLSYSLIFWLLRGDWRHL